jgi:hypothetical protein
MTLCRNIMPEEALERRVFSPSVLARACGFPVQSEPFIFWVWTCHQRFRLRLQARAAALVQGTSSSAYCLPAQFLLAARPRCAICYPLVSPNVEVEGGVEIEFCTCAIIKGYARGYAIAQIWECYQAKRVLAWILTLWTGRAGF